jgi:hypothetical protein
VFIDFCVFHRRSLTSVDDHGLSGTSRLCLSCFVDVRQFSLIVVDLSGFDYPLTLTLITSPTPV